MKIICLVGMPGSGKGTVVEVFKEKGLQIVNMGDVVRREAQKRGYEVTPANLGRVSMSLREEFGDEEIARRCAASIKTGLSAGSSVVIEGIRSLKEVMYFKEKFKGDFYLIAVHASPKTRFKRLKTRMREDDSGNWAEFEERDRRELGYGTGSAIALADYLVVNEGSIEELKEKIKDIYKALL